MTRATYAVEAAWSSQQTGGIVVGTSTVGGDGIILGEWGGHIWSSIFEDVKNTQMWRGRLSDLSQTMQGRCSIRLRDPTGRYNPENAGNLVNLVTNPSFEVGTSGCVAQGNATIARSTDYAYTGGASLKATCTADGSFGARRNVVPGGAIPQSPYSFSAYIYCPPAVAGKTLQFYIDESGGAQADSSLANETFVAVAGWQRLTAEGRTPTYADRTTFVWITQCLGGTATDIIYLDAMQCEQATSATTYCDGDQDNCRWSGTAHASTSYRGGPLYGSLDVMKPVRITATYGGDGSGLFYGYMTDIAHDPDKYVQESQIIAIDFTEWLTHSKTSIVIAEVTNERVDQLIGRILDMLGWTEATMRSFDVSSTVVPSWSADGTRSPLELIEDLLTIDRGMFFVDGSGRVCYRNRGIYYDSGNVVDTFTSAHMGRLKPSISAADIVNSQTVTKTGGSAQTATDATSRLSYGYRDGAAITSDYLLNDEAALDLAEFLVRLQKNPRVPAREVSLINGDAIRLTKQLTREIGDLVRIDESEGGTEFTGRIQAVEHDISEAFTVHRTRFMVQKAPLVPFIVGSSSVGSTHVVVY